MVDTVRSNPILTLIAVVGLSILMAPAFASDVGEDAKLRSIISGPQRTPTLAARDGARHPYEVLHFFGLKDDFTVVEIWPGGSGYWTEILAPYLRDHGHYYAAIDEADSPSEEAQKSNSAFHAKLAANTALYDRVVTSEFAGDRHEIAPAGSADLIVTFRNVHNWLAAHDEKAAFATFFKALKPGGILGVEEHRGRTDIPQDPEAKSGYVREDFTIAIAEAAGFKLLAKSEVNANPKDTKDYPAGVWTLPPVYRLGAVDRAKYEAIGESDRFVITFIKPK